jgi:hypothetical protein
VFIAARLREGMDMYLWSSATAVMVKSKIKELHVFEGMGRTRKDSEVLRVISVPW